MSMASMAAVEVRKFLVQIEEVFHEGGPPSDHPLRRGAVLVVARNPFAGRFVPEITDWMEDLKPLGLQMAERLLAALGGEASTIEGYGKGAIVGEAGELEHG